MIVVSIIGLLAILAVPAMTKSRMRAQEAAFLSDLRVLTGALEQFAITEGNYPPNAVPGVEPDGFGPYLPRHVDWTEDTQIGGTWDWDRASDHSTNIYGVYAGLSVYGPKRTSLQMAEIDAKIDDGDIDAGQFRRRTGGYIFILER